MNVELVEPVLDEDDEYKYYQAEGKGIKSWTDEGNEVYIVKRIPERSKKERKLSKLLEKKPCSIFISLGEKLNAYLLSSKRGSSVEESLYIMTDFSDPRPLKGLCIIQDDKKDKKEDLYYLAFDTDWNNIDDGNFEEIFAHELSHLWLYLLGFDSGKMRSNVYHCITGMTDPCTAFMEGLGNSLEIVSYENGLEELAEEKFGGLWDCGLDINAFLSNRETQLRYWLVKNNRMIYQKMLPDIENYDDYIKLHIDHITSSAFLPEMVKAGGQILASEGCISTIFYYLYNEDAFREFKDDDFYQKFDTKKNELTSLENLYLKILYTMTNIDFEKSEQPMIDFIVKYGESFPDEKEVLYRTFLELTHYTTVSKEAQKLFSDFYLTGRRAKIEKFKVQYKNVIKFKEKILSGVISGKLALDDALLPQVWVENTSCKIPPCPWMLERKVNFRFDLNTATLIDFMSITLMNINKARQILQTRKEIQGFKSLHEFEKEFSDEASSLVELG